MTGILIPGAFVPRTFDLLLRVTVREGRGVGVRVGSLRTKSVLELRFRAGLGLRSSDARCSSAKRDVQLTTRLR